MVHDVEITSEERFGVRIGCIQEVGQPDGAGPRRRHCLVGRGRGMNPREVTKGRFGVGVEYRE